MADVTMPKAQGKSKSDAKKRYLAKKAKKHRVLVKARRDAAPKHKQWNGPADSQGPVPNSDTALVQPTTAGPLQEDLSPSHGARSSPFNEDGNNEAGPSRPRSVEVMPSEAEEDTEVLQSAKSSTEGKRKKGKKRKASHVELELTKPDTGSAGVAPAEEEEEAARLRRKQEKREKREKRDKEDRRARQAKRKEEEAQAADRTSEAGKGEYHLGGDDELDAGDERRPLDPSVVTDEDIPDDSRVASEARDRDGSPLQAFPLPAPPAAPDPLLLSRLGLPEGLENAEIIDQQLSLPLEDLKFGRKQEGLGVTIKDTLKEMGINDFFAVQAALLPRLLPLPLVPLPFTQLDDYLISAPTGSGKTLAYAIPIVHILAKRSVRRLRALIVLPTRDLVIQVRETLEMLAKGTGLAIGSVTGHRSFSHEQATLVEDMSSTLQGGSSKLDILIATPGRLIDHLTQTPNFTLQHLRFLIIDEADRLLNQSYQNWLSQVLSHIRQPGDIQVPGPGDAVARSWQGLTDEIAAEQILTCQKLLFSATLTRDPAAIASLNLNNPKYLIVQSSTADNTLVAESFAIPDTLTEHYLALPADLKPLNLIHLLRQPGSEIRSGLVFTKSVESAERLVKLLATFEDLYESDNRVVVQGYTSNMKPSERKRIMSGFSSGEIHLLVCSDLVSRGVDLPTVAHVISYDTPMDMRKYVHRVGRTARAGRAGVAWTLVEKQEALHFKGMMKDAGRAKTIKKIKIKEDDLSPYREAYEQAMSRLRDIYGGDS